MRNFLAVLLTLVALGLTGCGYTAVQPTGEKVPVAWSEGLNQYQRRSDLVPELVHAASGAVASEQGTLVAVASALAGATKIKVTTAALLLGVGEVFFQLCGADGAWHAPTIGKHQRWRAGHLEFAAEFHVAGNRRHITGGRHG